MAALILPEERSTSRLSSLTAEKGIYLVLLCGSLGWRLAALGAAPLSTAEAQQALAAFHLSQGSATLAEQAANGFGGFAPALMAAQTLLFSLFAANDAWARLPVALFTALFPIAIWWLRPLIGRPAALLTALLLAISPIWLASGMQGLGAGFGLTALLFACGCAVQAASKQNPGLLRGAVITLAVAASSTAEFWPALIFALILWLVFYHSRKPEWLSVPQCWQLLAIFLVAFALLSTVFFLYPAGLQASLNLSAWWFSAFTARTATALLQQALIFLIYEPLISLFALAAFLFLPPQNRLRQVLYLFAAGAVLLALASGRPLAGVLLCLPPLALLAAMALAHILRWLAGFEKQLLFEATLVISALLGYGYISLSGLARRGELAFLVLALTAIGIGLALLGLVWVRYGAKQSLALFAYTALLALGLWALGSSGQATWARRQMPQEIIFPQATQPNVALLTHDLASLSWSRVGHSTELNVAGQQAAGPTIAWYLRGMSKAKWVEKIPVDSESAAIITASNAPLSAEQNYVGQDYILTKDWQPNFSSFSAFLRWLFYRQGDGVSQQVVTLWVRE